MPMGNSLLKGLSALAGIGGLVFSFFSSYLARDFGRRLRNFLEEGREVDMSNVKENWTEEAKRCMKAATFRRNFLLQFCSNMKTK